jgi:microcystin-dependent protein
MAYQGISTGTVANDGLGDSLLTGAVKINSNFTEIYTALGDGSTLNLSQNRSINTGDGLTGGGDLSADRTLAVDNTVVRTSGTQTIGGLKTFSNTVTAASPASFVGNGTIPIGGIIMWSGSIASIPTGWALCDGANATPDLRERFIVGAGGDNTTVAGTTGYTPGDAGGANSVALSIAEMPVHDHSNGTNSGSTNTTTNLTGQISAYSRSSLVTPDPSTGVFTNTTRNNNDAAAGTDDRDLLNFSLDVNHSHSIFVNAQGSGTAHENRPPYFALAFIMRTA